MAIYGRGLIVKRSHLSRMYFNGKTWEMRSSKTNFRGKFHLIESGSGLITGEAELMDCLPPINSIRAADTTHYHQVDDLSLLDRWRYPWVLANVKKYDEPIPYTHPQGAVIWVKLNIQDEPV